MAGLLRSEFNRVVDQLINYGQKGFEEVSFQENQGILVPITRERPNWFFRLVRWLFKGGYREAHVAEKS